MTDPSQNFKVPLTVRQHLVMLLVEQSYTVRGLATTVGVAERLVEDHLTHVMRSSGRRMDQRFVMKPPVCLDCGFRFHGRTRLKRPSRCPKSRSENISSPRFSINPTSEERTTRRK